MAMFTKQNGKICKLKNHCCVFQKKFQDFFYLNFRDDSKEYALKQIKGEGLSMSTCREIAVSFTNFLQMILLKIPNYLLLKKISAFERTETSQCYHSPRSISVPCR